MSRSNLLGSVSTAQSLCIGRRGSLSFPLPLLAAGTSFGRLCCLHPRWWQRDTGPCDNPCVDGLPRSWRNASPSRLQRQRAACTNLPCSECQDTGSFGLPPAVHRPLGAWSQGVLIRASFNKGPIAEGCLREGSRRDRGEGRITCLSRTCQTISSALCEFEFVSSAFLALFIPSPSLPPSC